MKALRCYAAELFGTFWLVLCGCGSVLLTAPYFAGSPDSSGIGLIVAALAFGLSVLTMVYAIGPVSGAHLNPAVTLGLTIAQRFSPKEVVPYIVAQLIGATAAALVLKQILIGAPGFDPAVSRFATNGFGEFSPAHYSMSAAFLCEVVMTAFFVFVILGATDKRAPSGLAGIAIGLCLTLIHLVSIPVTGTSVNPARSTGPALVAALSGNTSAFGQLWLFWVAPLVGAVIAAVIYQLIMSEKKAASNEQEVALGSAMPNVVAQGD